MILTQIEKGVLEFSLPEKKFIVRINNKTVANKSNIKQVIDDINFLHEKFPDKVERLYNYVIEAIESGDTEEFSETSLLIELSKSLVSEKIDDELLSTWVQPSKKTSKSIFFDKKEVIQVLEIISAIKILTPFIHSEYQQILEDSDVITEVSKRYSAVSQKLFSVIKARTFKWSQQELQLIKSIITSDFLTLYNFDFIFISVMPSYNWTKNPITFIVSVASENSSYLYLTYRSQQQTYSDIEISTSILDTVAYEVILQSIEKSVSDYISMTVGSLFSTPITTDLAIPLLSINIDIPVSYMLRKSIDKLLAYQYFTYLFVKQSDKLSKIFNKTIRLLQVASMQPITIRRSPHPVVLEVFKQELTYYKLHSKKPLLEIATNFSSIIDSELVYITSMNKFESLDKENYVKNGIRIISKIASDESETLRDTKTLKHVLKDVDVKYTNIV